MKKIVLSLILMNLGLSAVTQEQISKKTVIGQIDGKPLLFDDLLKFKNKYEASRKITEHGQEINLENIFGEYKKFKVAELYLKDNGIKVNQENIDKAAEKAVDIIFNWSKDEPNDQVLKELTANRDKLIKGWIEQYGQVMSLFTVDIVNKYEKKLKRSLSEVEWDNFAYQELKKTEKKHKVNFDKGHRLFKKKKIKNKRNY